MTTNAGYSKSDFNHIELAYVEICEFSETSVFALREAAFSDNSGQLTINPLSQENRQVLGDIFDDARLVAQNKQDNGEAVDNIVITNDDGDVYEFSPLDVTYNAQDGVFEIASAVQWPADASTEVIGTVDYVGRINCVCEPLEALQRLNDCTDEMRFEKFYTREVDPDTLVKVELDVPFPLGYTNFTLGMCPDSPDTLEVVDLCCNDDLETGSPEIVAKRLAWLDSTETGLMLDDIAGTPIAGNAGDLVGEVQDKVAPGVNPSWLREIQITRRPNYQPNAINGLPVLNFDGGTGAGNIDSLGLETGNAAGQGFNLFYLFRVEQSPESASVLSVGPSGGRGQNNVMFLGSWQLCRGFQQQGTQNNFVFRYQEQLIGNGSLDVPLDDIVDVYDGEQHFVTMNYDGTEVNIFIDGQLVLDSYVPTQPLLSGYYRAFTNRANQTGPNGDLAEVFIGDDTMTDDEIGTVNGYFICKWDVDPSQVTAIPGVELDEDVTYTAPSPFVEVTLFNGTKKIRNKYTGQEFAYPPVAGLGYCGDDCKTDDIQSQCDVCTLEEIDYQVDHQATATDELTIQDVTTSPYAVRFVRVNWGDGTTEELINPTFPLVHNYTDGGEVHSVSVFIFDGEHSATLAFSADTGDPGALESEMRTLVQQTQAIRTEFCDGETSVTRCLTGETIDSAEVVKCDADLDADDRTIARTACYRDKTNSGPRILWDEAQSWDGANPQWNAALAAAIAGGGTAVFQNVMNTGITITVTGLSGADFVAGTSPLPTFAAGRTIDMTQQPGGVGTLRFTLSDPRCILISATDVNTVKSYRVSSQDAGIVWTVDQNHEQPMTTLPDNINGNGTNNVSVGHSNNTDNTNTVAQADAVSQFDVEYTYTATSGNGFWGFGFWITPTTGTVYRYTEYTDGSYEIVNANNSSDMPAALGEWVEISCDEVDGGGGGDIDEQALAEAIVAEQRNITGNAQMFTGNGASALAVPAGARGCIRHISDHGGGAVRFEVLGGPITGASPEISGQAAIDLCGIDLSLIRFAGSAGGSQYSVVYEVWN